ncbi:MAG: IgGFc-binding protein [Bacteroidales bacterium]|nr:IgGFc-binding protein [Bacteroidales bacterium]
MKQQKFYLKTTLFTLLLYIVVTTNLFGQNSISNAGTNFFVAFGKNSNILVPDSTAGKKNVELILRINAEVQTTVELVFRNATSQNKTIIVPPGITDYKLTLAQTQACYWGKSTQPYFPELVSNKTLQVLTSAPITLVAMSSAYSSVEATGVLPVNRLGTRYIQQGMPPTPNNSNGFVLIATEDNTTVSITQTAVYQYNYPTLMNKGDVFFVNDDNYETRATVIETSKPVAMFHNSSRSTVEGRDNYMFEQMVPVSQWGTEFILPTSYNELNGQYAGFARIYPMGIESIYNVNGTAYYNNSSNSNQNIEIVWPDSYTYRKHDLILNAANINATACHVKTDKQVSVSAYNIPRTGVLYDIAQPGEAWLPPVAQGIQKVLVSPLDFDGTHVFLQMWHFFLIITPTSTMNNTTIAIDGGVAQPIQDFITQGKFTWVDANVRNSGYAVGKYYFGTSNPNATPPVFLHTKALVENSNGMIILAYGQGSYTNYFYAAGYGGRDLLCESYYAPELKNNTDLNICSGNIINDVFLKGLIIHDDTEDDIEYYSNAACTIPFTPITTNISTQQTHTIFAIFKNKFTGCKTEPSDALSILITVTNEPIISTIPPFDALCAGANLLLSTPTVTGNGNTVSEQGWQLETGVESGTYNNIVIPYLVSLSDNGKRVRYYAITNCGEIHSNAVEITVNPTVTPTITISATAE